MEHNVVGARELKTRLGTYLRRVRRGRTVVVTDRGLPIAEIRPIEPSSGSQAVLLALEAGGVLSIGSGKTLTRFRPLVSRGKTVSSAVSEDRGDRG